MSTKNAACRKPPSLPQKLDRIENSTLGVGDSRSEMRRSERAHLSVASLDDELWSRRQAGRDLMAASNVGAECAPLVPLVMALARLAAQRDAEVAAERANDDWQHTVEETERLA